MPEGPAVLQCSLVEKSESLCSTLGRMKGNVLLFWDSIVRTLFNFFFCHVAGLHYNFKLCNILINIISVIYFL